MENSYPTVQNIVGANGWLSDQKIKFFEETLMKTNREGIDKVLEFTRNTDFYVAPASGTYHSNYKGGLLDHSIVVYIMAMKYRDVMVQEKPELASQLTDEFVAIAALLHDICKTCFYTPATKWKKDSNGQWNSYSGYEINDTFPIGHGEKSVIMLQSIGLKLDTAEMLAIRFHMGFWNGEGNDLKYSMTRSLKMCPLVLLLQLADFSASTIFETEIKI
jgi:hypothetical protein